MTPHPHAPEPAHRPAPPDLVAATLLTSAAGAELHLVTRDGRRLRLATDGATARRLARALWPLLEDPPRPA